MCNLGSHLYMAIWMHTEGINIFNCLQFKETSRKHLKGMNYTRQLYFIRITFILLVLWYFDEWDIVTYYSVAIKIRSYMLCVNKTQGYNDYMSCPLGTLLLYKLSFFPPLSAQGFLWSFDHTNPKSLCSLLSQDRNLSAFLKSANTGFRYI